MRYDFYNTNNLSKPSVAASFRDLLHKKMLKRVSIQSVLDIGIGFGEFAQYCKKSSISWVGIEPNKRLRENMQQHGFTVYDGMMPTFPSIKEQFDAIHASHMIEHLNGLSEVILFLQNCQTLLKEKRGKYLILLYPDIEYAKFLFYQDYTHNFVTTKKRIENLLEDTGWKVTYSTYYTVCFFRLSWLISSLGRIFPYFILPKKFYWFIRLSFQRHALTIAELP